MKINCFIFQTERVSCVLLLVSSIICNYTGVLKCYCGEGLAPRVALWGTVKPLRRRVKKKIFCLLVHLVFKARSLCTAQVAQAVFEFTAVLYSFKCGDDQCAPEVQH